MWFQVEFVKFDPYCSAPRAIVCLAKKFDSSEKATIEAEREFFATGTVKEAEGFRIVENGVLVVAQTRFAPRPC